MRELNQEPGAGNREPGTGRQAGFSLVESLIAVTILAFGLLSIAAAFSQGLQTLSGSNLDILAREKAAEAIESVFTARDTRTTDWVLIKNVEGETGSDGGIFYDGDQPMTTSGPDGMVNTEDDGDMEALVAPGGDGYLGTADDVVTPLTNFTRAIQITAIGPRLRQLKVTIKYIVGSHTREYIITTYISAYS